MRCTDPHIPQYGNYTSSASRDMLPACTCQIVLIWEQHRLALSGGGDLPPFAGANPCRSFSCFIKFSTGWSLAGKLQLTSTWLSLRQTRMPRTSASFVKGYMGLCFLAVLAFIALTDPSFCMHAIYISELKLLLLFFFLNFVPRSRQHKGTLRGVGVLFHFNSLMSCQCEWNICSLWKLTTGSTFTRVCRMSYLLPLFLSLSFILCSFCLLPCPAWCSYLPPYVSCQAESVG